MFGKHERIASGYKIIEQAIWAWGLINGFTAITPLRRYTSPPSVNTLSATPPTTLNFGNQDPPQNSGGGPQSSNTGDIQNNPTTANNPTAANNPALLKKNNQRVEKYINQFNYYKQSKSPNYFCEIFLLKQFGLIYLLMLFIIPETKA